MSVNGLGSVSRVRQCKRNSVPLKLDRDHIRDVDVQCDQQTSGAVEPVKKKDEKKKRQPLISGDFLRGSTHHKAVAAKHIVLPTYIGLRSTLNGNPSTRWSIRMPK